MRTAYILTIAGLLIVIGMLMYPTLHFMNGLVDTTGFVPLLKMAVAILPYAFLGFIGYAIFQMAKRR